MIRTLVVAFRFAARLLDDDAALLCNDRCGDHVHVLQHRAQQAGDRRRGERPRVHLRDCAFVGQLHLFDAGLGELAGERAELLRQRHEGLEFRRFLGADRGEVQGVGDGAADQIVGHLLGDLERHVLLRLCRRGAEMRRAHYVGQREQRACCRRFLDEHVEGGAGDVPRGKRIEQRRLVDELAAGTIDQADPLLRQSEGFPADNVAGLVSERGMQGNEVRPAQQLLELDLSHPETESALGRQVRIVGDHLHPQPDRAVGDDRADVAAANDAEGFSEHLDAEKLVLLPFAGARRRVCFGNLPCQRQHERDRVLGGRDRVAERRVHHDDAARGRSRYVDIVDADAGAADHLEAFRPFEDFRRYLGRRADGEPVEAVDRLGKLLLVLAETGLKLDLNAAVFEDRDRGGRKRVGDEYSGLHGISCRCQVPRPGSFMRCRRTTS